MFSKPRFCIETATAIISVAIFVLTLVEPTWFELLFNEAPDGGDGSLESTIAIVASLVATTLLVRLAWREWRRRPAGSTSRAG